jgi:hypothetical protein
MTASGAAALSIRWPGEPHGSPDHCRSALLPVDPRQAAGAEHDLRHGRFRHGRVRCVLHAEPVVSCASATSGGGSRAIELSDPVRDGPDPLRQSDPRHSLPQRRRGLDPVEPTQFDAAFAAALSELEQSGAIDQLRVLNDHLLIALDGSEYYCSTELHCPNCSTRKHSKGKVEYHHSLLAAALVCPGHNHAVPLEPEFIVPQDGHDKQDCESRAMRRWLVAHAARYAQLKPVYLGDDLYSRQPACQAVLDTGAHFIFVCKPTSHQTIEEYRTGSELEQLTTRVKVRGKWGTHRYRWLSEVPLRDGEDALKVNWSMIEILDPAGKTTYRNSFITDLPVGRDNVAELAACVRARWKIESVLQKHTGRSSP